MPRAVLTIRQAISPRLAIRIFLNILWPTWACWTSVCVAFDGKSTARRGHKRQCCPRHNARRRHASHERDHDLALWCDELDFLRAALKTDDLGRRRAGASGGKDLYSGCDTNNPFPATDNKEACDGIGNWRYGPGLR